MPSIETAPVGAAITADTTAAGVVTVASTANWYPGQVAWMSGAGKTSRRVKVISITDGTHMVVRQLPDADTGSPNYGLGGSNLADFTLAAPSRIDAARQLVPVDQPTFSKLPSVS